MSHFSLLLPTITNLNISEGLDFQKVELPSHGEIRIHSAESKQTEEHWGDGSK
jgi:hypothetical protein